MQNNGNEEKMAFRNKEKEEHFKFYGFFKRRNRNEHVFARPNRLRENAETVISCREPGPARKKKEVYH